MKLTGKRIFIVEDNSHNRVVYRVVLTKNGAQVDFNNWGRDTLDQMYNFGKIDLIILDLMLPRGTSGFDVLKEIRQTKQYKDIPIVAVSAAEPAFAIPQSQQLGFDGFIAKPIDDELFVDQLQSILDGQPVWYAGMQ